MHASFPVHHVKEIQSHATRQRLADILPLPSKAAPGDLIGLATTIRGGERRNLRPFTQALVKAEHGHMRVDYPTLLETNEHFALKIAHIAAILHHDEDLSERLIDAHHDLLYPESASRAFNEDADFRVFVGLDWAALLADEHDMSFEDLRDTQSAQEAVNMNMIALAAHAEDSAHGRMRIARQAREAREIVRAELWTGVLPDGFELTLPG